MTLLQTFINDAHQSRPSLAVFQSSAAQTTIPLLRQFLSKGSTLSKGKSRQRILFSLLYLPSNLIDDQSVSQIEVHDWLDNVPGYSPEHFNAGLQLLSTIDQGKSPLGRSGSVRADRKGWIGFSSRFHHGCPRCGHRLHRLLAVRYWISFRNLQISSRRAHQDRNATRSAAKRIEVFGSTELDTPAQVLLWYFMDKMSISSR